MAKHIYLKQLDSLPPMFVNYLKNNKVENYLDFGCGYGFWFYVLQANNLLPERCVGLDLEPEHIESLVNNNPTASGVVGDVTKHHFNKAFDLVSCNQCIEHTPDDGAVVDNIYKSLRRGGVSYVSSIIRKKGAWYPYKYKGGVRLSPAHVKEYRDLDEFVKLFTNRKFKILQASAKQYWLKCWTTPVLKGKLAVPVPGFYTCEVLVQK